MIPRHIRLIAPALAAAATLVASGGVGTAASPGSAATGGLTRVIDDTGSIAVSVPAGWTVDTTPMTSAGVALPRIVARPAPDDYLTEIRVSAHVYAADLEAAVCGVWWMEGQECEPYDDGNLAGFRTFHEECCGSTTRWIKLTGNPTAGEHVTASFVVTYDESREADAAFFDQLAPTVEVLASPYPPEWEASPTALPPPVVGAALSVWPYADFYSVPRLGEEPVLGSGCGANGDIGETIPDGLWAGAVTYVADEDRWAVNLMCVYRGVAADDVLAAGTANVVAGDRDYLVVDNNPRVRSVPNRADSVSTTFADVRTNDTCQIGGSQGMPFDNSQAPGSQAWIRIHEGAATWVLFGCDAGFPSPGG